MSLYLDVQHFCSSTIETRCCACVCQCDFATRQYRQLVRFNSLFVFDTLIGDHYFDEQIRVAKVLGSDVYLLLRHLHFNERAWYHYVSHLQTGARQPEQASGSTRVLGGKAQGIQIFTLRIIVTVLFLRYTIPGICFYTAGPCNNPICFSF
jgi:hypothetical protein